MCEELCFVSLVIRRVVLYYVFEMWMVGRLST